MMTVATVRWLTLLGHSFLAACDVCAVLFIVCLENKLLSPGVSNLLSWWVLLSHSPGGSFVCVSGSTARQKEKENKRNRSLFARMSSITEQ